MIKASDLRLIREHERTNYSIDPGFLTMALLVAVGLPIHLLRFIMGSRFDPASDARITKHYRPKQEE